MNTNVEELLREGMERFTEGVTAPAGLVQRARRHRRQRLAARTAVACATAAATVVAAVAVTAAAARPSGNAASARTVAYVVGRVRHALATQNMVYRGRTMGSDGEPSTTWVYGQQYQWIEYYMDGTTPYSAEGTAIVGGKHFGVYVLYPDHKWTGSPGWGTPVSSACSKHGALGLGGIPITTGHWSSFISATLACGAASVTGHVLIDGVETTQITGKPVTVPLSGSYSKVVHEKWARAEWTLYVDPQTYLPVRITGSTETFGGSGGHTRYGTVTDVQWLPPTAGNIARTLVTVPAGFQQTTLANV